MTPHLRFSERKGIALIIVLFAVVLITTLILTFLSSAVINSRVVYSSTNEVKADILGRSSLDIVVGEIREEIRTGSNNLNGGNSSYPSLYQPLAAAKVTSQKMGISSPDPAIGATTLLKVSAPGIAINPSTGGRVLGSSLSIAVSSSNGRAFSGTSWFGANGPQLGSQSTLPTWVFLSRSGVDTSPSYSLPTSDPNYIVGRFAYTVYDMGGLLDANVAGYPSADAANAAFKGPAPYVDLSVIPGIGSAANVDSFVTWRNVADASSETAYESYLQSYGLKYGFLSTKSGDNAFLSRMDLIHFATQGGYGLNSSGLGYLTHFSASLNAPSWVPPVSPPGSITNYNASAETATSSNRDVPNVRFTGITGASSITHYRDDGTFEYYTVNPGDPLIQYRFSLAKLAWVTSEGPSAGLSSSDPLYNPAGTARAIQSCFGLQWSSGNDRWNYVGPAGSTTQSSIETLAQVAAETIGREPNFFELLKAGILSGSLGMSSPEENVNSNLVMPGPSNMTLDAQPDLQILKIGANILNCAAPDDYPIILTMSYAGLAIEEAGVTDLPYLYCIHLNGFSKATTTSISALDYVLVPIFINPQRYAATATSTPASVTLNIVSGTLTDASVNATSTTGPSYLDLKTSGLSLVPKSLVTGSGSAALTPITIPSSQFNQFRSGAQPQLNSAANNTLGALVSYQTSSYATAQAFRIFSYENEADSLLTTNPPPTSVTALSSSLSVSSLLFCLQYLARDGQMKTYYTMGGNPALATTTGISRFIGLNADVAYGSNLTTFAHTALFACFDPRSGRLGPSWGNNRVNLGPSPPLNLSQPVNTSLQNDDRIYNLLPYGGGGNLNILLGLLPQGGQAQNQTYSGTGSFGGPYVVNTLDPDEMASTSSITPASALLRPTDGWLGTAANGWAANPYAQQSGGVLKTTDESRPVILHRPYRSVAELGYVFRDSPWKSLSFFDQTSADGALLDLFSVSDEPSLAAGRINLNTQQTTAWTALLNGAGQNADGSNPLASPATVASAYNSYAFSGGTPSSSMPWNIASLVNFMSSTPLSSAGLDAIKYHREFIVRSLADATQTRTWNLLIDVVAQSGHYIPDAQSLNNFLVEGEKRYWLSVAIDRYTDKIVKEQLEPIDE